MSHVEFKHVAVWGEAPVNNPSFPKAQAVLEQYASEGWEFAGMIPGQDHSVAEHRKPIVYLFKRPL